MVYVLVEMRCALPWDHVRDKHEIGRLKTETTDETLLQRCAPKMTRIVEHLRSLDYFKRPDYALIYNIFLVRTSLIIANRPHCFRTS